MNPAKQKIAGASGCRDIDLLSMAPDVSDFLSWTFCALDQRLQAVSELVHKHGDGSLFRGISTVSHQN